MTKLKSKIKIRDKKSQLVLFAIIALLIVGGYFVFHSKAALPASLIEVGSTANSPAITQTDTTASGSNVVQFKSSGTVNSDCLSRATKVTASGSITSTPLSLTPPPGATVDARTATVTSDSGWLVTPHSTSEICWVGGEYMDTITDAQAGTACCHDAGSAWGDIWHHNGGFTLGADGSSYNDPNWIIDGVAVHHTGDAFNMSSGSENFEIRNSHIYDIRDDCVQNDYYHTGYVHDNLFEGCYDGFSSKASQGTKPSGTGKTWTISNNVVYIKPMPSVYKGDVPGSVYILKWAKPSDGLGTTEHVVFRNNIVRVDKCPFQSGSSCSDSFYFPPDIDWSGNSLYWGGSGPVPASLASWFSSAHGSKMIPKSEWDSAVADWKTAHPGVK